MKNYLSLIPISAQMRRRQNRMTILCIVISVFLITAVFSMADMAVRMETNNRISKDGSWHLMFQNIDRDTAEQISERQDVCAFSSHGSLNDAIDKNYFVGKKKAAIYGAEEDIMQLLPGFTKGEYPSDNEVIVTRNICDFLPVGVGDTITLTMPDGKDKTLTVVGFNSDSAVARQYDAVILCLNLSTFEEILSQNHEKEEFTYYLQFKKHTDLSQAVSEIKEQYQLSDENIDENSYQFALEGESDNSYISGLYGVAAVLGVLVLMAGIFMITASLNSNILQRTGFYGMLRCLGTSKKQVMRLVRLEALFWCRVAIPLGVVLGIFVTWGLCAFLRRFIGYEFESLPMWEISPAGIVAGIVSGIVTVWLAASSPARKAARVSPISAVSGNAHSIAGLSAGTQRASVFRKRITASLGVCHATASKKNLFLMTGSFALSIVLFLCFSALLGWLKMALNPLKAYAPDISITGTEADNRLSKNLAAEIEEDPVVKRAFGRMYQCIPACYQDREGSIDLISYEEKQFAWAREDLVAGEIPEDIDDGKFYVLTVFDKSNSLTVGDTIRLDGAELTVSGVLDDSPFDSNDTPTVICSEKTFESLTGQDTYAVIDIQLTGKATDAEVNALRSSVEQKRNGEVTFSDRRESNRMIESTYWSFSMFVYAFLAVIAVITILNIVNSIALSVCARTRQYGIMRAVGMDGVQVTRMIAAEAVTYGVTGLITGCLLGLPLYRWLYERIVTNYFGVACPMPWVCLLVISGITLISVLAAVHAPAKRINGMAITETINEL